MELSKFIKKTFELSKCKTQVEFGRKIGSTAEKDSSVQTMVANLMSGHAKPSMKYLESMIELAGYKISDCLKLPDDWKEHKELHGLLDDLLNGPDGDAVKHAISGWHRSTRDGPGNNMKKSG